MSRLIQRALLCFLITISLITSVYAQDQRPLIYQAYSLGASRIDIIDPLTFQIVDQIPLDIYQPEIIILHPNEKIAFVANDFLFGKGLLVVDLVNRQVINELFSTRTLNSIKMGLNGKLYVMLTDTNELAEVNIDTYQIERTTKLNLPPRSIEFHPDKKRAYIITGLRDQTFIDQFYEFNLESYQVTRTIDQLPDGTGEDNDLVVISPDGKKVYLSRDGKILVIDTTAFAIVDEFRGTGLTNNLKISPDGKTLFACDVDFGVGQLVAIDLTTGIEKKRILADGRYLNISPDGKVLYLSDIFFTLDVYDAETLEFLGFYSHFGQPGIALDFAVTGNFNNIAPPSIKFTNFTDGQTIQKGKPFTFKWQTTPGSANIGNHKIEFSNDNGATFFQQGEKVLSATTQESTYQAPVLPANNLLAKVTTVDILARRAEAVVKFNVAEQPSGPADTQAPTVNFIKPAGGEKFTSGDTINLSWNSADNIGVAAQDLALSTDGGKTFPITIATGLTGLIQSFNYQIPSALATTTARLQLIVRDLAGNTAQAITTANFQIQPAPVIDTQAPVVIIPTLSQDNNIFPAGQSIIINWLSTDNIAVVSQEILVSLDNGNSFQLLSSFGADTSTFTLNIVGFDKATSVAIVKITATDAAGNKGEQSGSLILRPNIELVNYFKPMLSINGAGFTVANETFSLQVFVNGKDIPASRFTIRNNTTIVLKGNKKSLGLVKGSNTVKVMVNALESNTVNFNF